MLNEQLDSLRSELADVHESVLRSITRRVNRVFELAANIAPYVFQKIGALDPSLIEGSLYVEFDDDMCELHVYNEREGVNADYILIDFYPSYLYIYRKGYFHKTILQTPRVDDYNLIKSEIDKLTKYDLI